MRKNLLIPTALAAVLLTAACAQGDPESPQPSISPSGTPSTSPSVEPSVTPTFSPPPPTSKPPAGEISVTGTVEMLDIEGGCKVLRAGPTTVYEIKGGDPEVLKVGAKVTVRGKIRSDIMTICQVGPVLEVLSSQPA